MKKIGLIILIVLVLMLIPIRDIIYDGGSIEYKAVLYKVTKIHRLSEESSTGYEDGLKVEILGIQVYHQLKMQIKALDESKVKINDNGVVLSVKEDTITKDGATFILKNNTNNILNYGCDYELEVKRHDKWYKFNVISKFSCIYSQLSENEIRELKIVWKDIYLNLKPGEYRILKKVNFETEENKDFYIATEFIIK